MHSYSLYDIYETIVWVNMFFADKKFEFSWLIAALAFKDPSAEHIRNIG
jgi:hypothetical protein